MYPSYTAKGIHLGGVFVILLDLFLALCRAAASNKEGTTNELLFISYHRQPKLYFCLCCCRSLSTKDKNMAVNTAPVKWAQRADSIYLTINLPDVTGEQLKLTKDTLSFRQERATGQYWTVLDHNRLCFYLSPPPKDLRFDPH